MPDDTATSAREEALATKRAARATKTAAEAKLEADCLELRKAGHTYQAIADHYKLATAKTAHRAVQRALERAPARAAEELRALENERYDHLQRAHWPQAIKGDHEATKQVLAIMAARRALNGLDAPTKIDFRAYIQQQAPALAAEMGLDEQEILALADEIVRGKA